MRVGTSLGRASPLVERAGRWLAAAVVLVAGPAVAQAPASDRAAAIVVLDGSNSMNGRLPGDKALKYQIVRDALRASLPRIQGTEVGLASFGHRRPSDCSDADVVVPPTRDAGRVTDALERLQPRGFSPVVLAVRSAARALPADTAKSSIVLVLDDLASCRSEDPCAVAVELKRQNPALAIHVVVLGPRAADLPVLACMARETGGQLWQVRDAAGVAPAIDEALKFAGLDRSAAPPSPAAASKSSPSAADERDAQRRSGPAAIGIDPTRPGLHLTAQLGRDTPVLTIPITWRVRTADAAPLVTTTAPGLSLPLPNGRYEIDARAGLVSVKRPIEITSQGPMPVTIDLNAALLAVTAPLSGGGEPAPGTTITVHAVGSSLERGLPGGAPLWIGQGGRSDVVVPAGSYRVTASAGLASTQRIITAGSGITADVAMPLEAGRVVIEDRDSAGQAAGPVQIVLEADAQVAGAGRSIELHRSASRRLDLVVPAGSYAATLHKDGAEARERLVVKAGDTIVRQVAVPSTRLRIAGTLGRAAPTGLPVSYRIERIDTAARVLQRWGEAEPVFALSPGRYRIEARLGAQNAVGVREVELRAADGEQRLDIELDAGRVQLKIAGANGGLGLGEVYWQIRNERGESIWQTGQAEPELALMAGRYVAVADSRGRTYERTFEVRAADRVTIEVGG
jgi:Ca-activated chloride channel family protein